MLETKMTESTSSYNLMASNKRTSCNNNQLLSSNSSTDRQININNFDNFYRDDKNNQDQSACSHLFINPISNRICSTSNNFLNSDQLLPSNTEKQLFNYNLLPSTICYQTFKNENSPFNSPLKRSITFAGVFNTLFKHADYNHLLEPRCYLGNCKPQERLRNSKSKYDYEARFTLSEPSPNEYHHHNKNAKQLITSSSTTNLLASLKDLQNIKQNLLSMAAVLTKHSFSSTGRILDRQQQSKVDLIENSLPIPNSLSNSSKSSSDTPSCSLYTNNETSTVIALQDDDLPSFNLSFCTLCLQYVDANEFIILDNCKCVFCRDCLEQYCTIIIRDHSLTSSQITCPSSDCPNLNSYLTSEQIKQLVDQSTFELYKKIKLDLEVHLDPNRVWCPRPNCETVCAVSTLDFDKIENDFNNEFDKNKELTNNKSKEKIDRRVPVNCRSCNLTFCLHCRNAYHGKMPCQSPSEDESLTLLLSRTRTPNSLSEFIKKCPRCDIFIERDTGCAQMLCPKCKHVFCWFCLSSLEEDFLLRHYDSGSCKNKLGHSKGTLLWLRFQVVAVFIGFILFLLLVSPLLLISAPIVLVAHHFCNFSISTKIFNKDGYLDVIEQNRNNLQQQQADSTTKLNTLPKNNRIEKLIDFNDHEANEQQQSNLINKNQHLIQAYVQNNGTHKLIDQSIDLFEEHPIKLSGYNDRAKEEKNEKASLFSWFNFKNNKKSDSLPRLSSMLDVEKHQQFMKELGMADKLNLDNQLNSVDIDRHFIIINRQDTEQQETNRIWWKFWRKN